MLSIKNKSHRVTAEVSTVGDETCEGVIVAQGGFVGGWAIYAKNGRPGYCYNFYGVELFYVEGTTEAPPSRHQRSGWSSSTTAAASQRAATCRLFVDDRLVGEGRVERTQPLPFASDEPFEIGRDLGSPVTPTTPPANSTARSTGSRSRYRQRDPTTTTRSRRRSACEPH